MYILYDKLEKTHEVQTSAMAKEIPSTKQILFNNNIYNAKLLFLLIRPLYFWLKPVMPENIFILVQIRLLLCNPVKNKYTTLEINT